MGKFYVTIRTKFGEISVEGDSSKEVLELVKEAISLESDITAIIPAEILAPSVPQLPTTKKELEGIIEVTSDGRPQIIVSPKKLTAKDVIGLLLYFKRPEGLLLSELEELMSLSWKAVKQPYIAANLGQMKGLILKEGSRGAFIYKLSGLGRNWIKNTLLPKLKGEKSE